ncbi:Glucan endo-1,3-alpha-glucosidase agn1 [Paecilomyces lecythidis]
MLSLLSVLLLLLVGIQTVQQTYAQSASPFNSPCQPTEAGEDIHITPHWIVDDPKKRCSDSEKVDILKELRHAREMALTAAQHLQEGPFYETFFSECLREDPNFATDIAETYKRMYDVMGGEIDDYQIQLSCDNTTPRCKGKNWLAHANDAKRTINFCKSFFSNPEISSTSALLERGPRDLREAQRTRSAIIIHEAAHTTYVMSGLRR